MKLVIILEDVRVANMPEFVKGQKVNIKDELADQLVANGVAKFPVETTMTQEVVVKKEEEKEAKRKLQKKS